VPSAWTLLKAAADMNLSGVHAVLSSLTAALNTFVEAAKLKTLST
jgi:hypothetical protein